MLKFNEELLQFIWQHRLLKPLPLVTHSGKEISILKPGEPNRNAGPDFTNARVRINDITLAGNIEVHIKTSDWLKHKHQHNKSYDNLILHVVYAHDAIIPQNTDNAVEVLVLKPLIAEDTFDLYGQLYNTGTKLPCASQLQDVNDLKFISWMDRMTVERLEEKVKRVNHMFSTFGGDYVQTFFSLILRNFGFKVNAEPFEMLALYLDVKLFLKHADNLLQLEALLLGTAGLLEQQVEDSYIRSLQNEFEFLRAKYSLRRLPKESFKFSAMRPANFPTVRLAQFAALVHANPALFTNPQKHLDAAGIKSALDIKLQGYWKNHYTTGGRTMDKDLGFGMASIENVIINTFAPFFFFCSKQQLKPELGDASVALLNACVFENNAKTRLFSARKNELTDAGGSQAIINLYDNYCVKKQCLKCGIAAAILKPC